MGECWKREEAGNLLGISCDGFFHSLVHILGCFWSSGSCRADSAFFLNITCNLFSRLSEALSRSFECGHSYV